LEVTSYGENNPSAATELDLIERVLLDFSGKRSDKLLGTTLVPFVEQQSDEGAASTGRSNALASKSLTRGLSFASKLVTMTIQWASSISTQFY
jgi:hypothetical protein